MSQEENHTELSQKQTVEPPRRIRSSELFGDQRRVIIEHADLDYILQITRQGKLILTK